MRRSTSDAGWCAGGSHVDNACADQLFSAAKVQISRILKKYLPDAPAADKTPMEIQTQQSQVVAAVVAFAQYLCSDGTAVEAAERLRMEAAASAEGRRAAAAAERERSRAETKERRAARARGEIAAGDGASDLEDDLASEADGDLEQEMEDAEAGMLACMSLSKLMKDHIEAHAAQPQGRALSALVTNTFNAYTAEDWMQTQVRGMPSPLCCACVPLVRTV